MKTRILTILALSPKGIPRGALRTEYGVRFQCAVGDVEFASALAELRGDGFTVEREDQLTGDTLITATKKGLAALRPTR